MTHCGEKWVEMVEKHPEICDMSEDYRRKVDYWIDICDQIVKRGFDRKIVLKKFPEGAARELRAIKKDALREKALNYICERLKRGESITGSDLKKSVAVWSGKEKITPCCEVKRNTNVLSPSPDHEVKPEPSMETPPKQPLKIEPDSVPLSSVPKEDPPVAIAVKEKEIPACKQGKPCPDPNGKNWLVKKPADGKEHLKGDVCDYIGIEIKQLPSDECPMVVALRKRQAAAALGFGHGADIDPITGGKFIKGAPIKIVKTPFTDAELEEWAKTGIERAGFSKGEQEQIHELVGVHYEGIKNHGHLITKAITWFLAQAEGE